MGRAIDRFGGLVVFSYDWCGARGIVEKDESPLSDALREVKEELNITLSADGIVLASLDYMAAGRDKTEALMFLYSPREEGDR